MSIKLAHDMNKDETSFFGLPKNEQISLIEKAVLNRDFTALEAVTNTFSGIYDYDEHHPFWLKSDFNSDIWILDFELNGVTKKTIRWHDIILDDGERLTSKKHVYLLNTFKYWITATDNPLENGGKILKPITVDVAIRKVISLIDAFLLNGSVLQLATHHLKLISDDFLMSLFTKIAKGYVENGIYDYHDRVKKFLLEKMISISDQEAHAFGLEHPFIYRDLDNEDCTLNFSVHQRIKACCWLAKEGYYNSGNNNRDVIRGNSAILVKKIYFSRAIGTERSFLTIEELQLGDEILSTEYPAVPNRDNSNRPGYSVITTLLKNLKLISVTHSKKAVSHFPEKALQNLTLSRIQQHVIMKPSGRIRTLPIDLIFRLFLKTYEFTSTYQTLILDSVLRVFSESAKKTKTRSKLNNKTTRFSEHAVWAETEALSLVDDELIGLGVNRISVLPSGNDVFKTRREYQGLFDLYSVLIGSIQILVGVMMARRQDELVTLRPNNNLFPNIDPSSTQGESLDYHLIFKNKKTGNGGQHAQNETIKRPIPRSIAIFIWKMEQFNKSLINKKLTERQLSLFNNINHKNFTIFKINQTTYNTNLDVVCDFFETPTIRDENNELRRYYVRQHQLRRFFAMVFFWSGGLKHLDSLRWMLGHTDLEHLYHYITEAEPGSVLNGVKASYLVDSIQNKIKLENIDTLREVIAKRYGISPAFIELSSKSQFIKDYDDDSFTTIPSISVLKQNEQMEQHILELLEESSISLEPEFFTVRIEGHERQSYHLVLKVKDQS